MNIRTALINAPAAVVKVIESSTEEGAGYTLVKDEDYALIRTLYEELGIEGQ